MRDRRIRSIPLLIALLLLVLIATAARATPWNHTSWPPPSANTDVAASVPMYAAVTAGPPPSITLNFIKSGAYQIFRKDPAATTWGTAVATFASDVNTWTDTNVAVGQMYEYKCMLTDPPASPTLVHIPNPKTYKVGPTADPTGYLLAGINVDETQPRGRIIVLVANDVPAKLPTEYNQYLSDLQADGWFVHQIPVAPLPISPAGYDVGGTNALASVVVTSGGTGYVSGTTGTTNGTTDFSFTDTITGSVAFCTITVTGGTITAATVAAGGGGGGFYPGDSLTIGQVAAGTGSGATFQVGSVTTSPLPTPASIRAQIQAIYNQYPGQVKNLVIVGRVPACRTGSTYIGDPDGHQVNDGATGADGYYANMTGVWTDSGSNSAYFNNSGISLTTGELNTPHDNKFDQYYMSDSGGEADLGFGRIDLSNGISAQYEALKAYFAKLHRFKTCSPDFLPGRRVAFRYGDFENVDGTGWNMAYSLNPHKGPGAPSASNPASDIDCIAGTDLPAVVSASFDADAAYSGQSGPYLFYFKGSGGPGVGGGGKAVFWTGCQSHWGWWYSSTTSSGDNSEELRLGENSFGLSWTWSIFGTRYFYHRMNLGLDAGDMMRISINNVDSSTGTYSFVTDSSTTDGGYIAPCTGALFMNHIGDPTLRFLMVAPPRNLSVVGTSAQPALTWTASSDPAIAGYHVYRAPLSGGVLSGPYTRVTTAPVAATTYTDSDPSVAPGTGPWSYLVRAVKLETTGSGSFYNASLGVIQSVDQSNPPAPLTIASPSVLPMAAWGTSYAYTLTASGGVPNDTWAQVSGSLPPGLSLVSSGLILGTPSTAGSYTFTAQATDALGQTAQGTFTLASGSNQLVPLLPEASGYTIAASNTRVQGPTETMPVGPSNNLYLRFNIAGLSTNNTLVSAVLRLFVAPGTATNNTVLLESALTPDSLVNWSMATLDWSNQPGDNSAVPPSIATSYPAALGYVDLDVSQQLAYALANNTTGKFGVRIFTQSNQAVNLCSAYSYNNAVPELLVQTSNAPKIAINSPTDHPAVIFSGSSLSIIATVTAVPAQAANLTTHWTQVSGPGVATFASAATPNTSVTFSAPGDYLLQLAADDSVLQSAQTVVVRVSTVAVNGPIDSMTLHLPFNESSGSATADTSGSANNGTLFGTASFSSAGVTGNALATTGGSSGVQIPDGASNANPLDGQQAMSISLWVYPTALATDNSFFNLINKSGAFQIQVRQLSNGGQVWNNIGNFTTQQGVRRLVAGQWNSIIGVFNGNSDTDTLQLYVNGVPDSFSNLAAGSIVPRKATSPTFVGASATNGNNAPNGLLDEVRIYKRALTLSEILDLAGKAPANTGPVISTTSNVAGSVNSPLNFTASVTDDGHPSPGALTYHWGQLTGPGLINFASPGSLSTTGTPNAPGTYHLLFTAGDGAIATSSAITAVISAQTFSSWAASNGLSGGNAQPGAVLQPDGLTSLFKYALGLSPSANYPPNSPALPTVNLASAAGTNYLTLSFNGMATDVSYTVQATSDLTAAWTTIRVFPAGGAPPGSVVVQDTQSTSSSTKRFMRLLMVLP